MSFEDNNYNKGEFTTNHIDTPQNLETKSKGDISMPDDNKVTFDSIFSQDNNPPQQQPYSSGPSADAGSPAYGAQPVYGAPAAPVDAGSAVYNPQPIYGPQPAPVAPADTGSAKYGIPPVYTQPVSTTPADAGPAIYNPAPVYSTQPTYGIQTEQVTAPVYPTAPIGPVYQPSTPPPYSPYTYGTVYPEAGMAPQMSYSAPSAPKSKTKEKRSFKAVAILVCVAVVLGGATIGFGLSVGGAFAQRFKIGRAHV